MQLSCPSCAALIEASHIDLPSGMAKCALCHSVFSFRDGMVEDTSSSSTGHDEHDDIGLPDRFQIERGDPLVISWPWRSQESGIQLAFMGFFLVFWFGFLFVWNGIALASGAYGMMVFSLFHVVIGGVVGVSTLRTMLNTTTITVDRSRLKIDVGPVPVAGTPNVASSSIEQLFVVSREHRGKRGRRWHTFDVMARTRDGREQKIVAALGNERQAWFLEQQLERKLGLVDRPVTGEHR
jgi:hypothetical protein